MNNSSARALKEVGSVGGPVMGPAHSPERLPLHAVGRRLSRGINNSESGGKCRRYFMVGTERDHVILPRGFSAVANEANLGGQPGCTEPCGVEIPASLSLNHSGARVGFGLLSRPVSHLRVCRTVARLIEGQFYDGGFYYCHTASDFDKTLAHLEARVRAGVENVRLVRVIIDTMNQKAGAAFDQEELRLNL